MLTEQMVIEEFEKWYLSEGKDVLKNKIISHDVYAIKNLTIIASSRIRSNGDSFIYLLRILCSSGTFFVSENTFSKTRYEHKSQESLLKSIDLALASVSKNKEENW